jgi:hypothetical protein
MSAAPAGTGRFGEREETGVLKIGVMREASAKMDAI